MKKGLVILISFFVLSKTLAQKECSFMLSIQDSLYTEKNMKYVFIILNNKGLDTIYFETPLIKPKYDSILNRSVYIMSNTNNMIGFYTGYLNVASHNKKEKWLPKLYFTAIPPNSSKEIIFSRSEKMMSIVFRFALKKEIFFYSNLYGDQIIERIVTIY